MGRARRRLWKPGNLIVLQLEFGISGSHAPAWEQVRTLQRHETLSRCGILAAGAATIAFPRWSVGTSQRVFPRFAPPDISVPKQS